MDRNIKPANIFVSDGRFKIGDFGFAKKADDLDEKMMKSIVETPLICLLNVWKTSFIQAKMMCILWESYSLSFYMAESLGHQGPELS